MAPMAGGIAYGKEDGLIFCLGFVKSFVTPWKPVYRVMGMLQKIRRFLMD